MTASVDCWADAQNQSGINENKSDIMKVKLPTGETEHIEISSTRVDSLLHQFGIKQSSVIVVMNEQIIPEDTNLCNEDELQIIRVVYGG